MKYEIEIEVENEEMKKKGSGGRVYIAKQRESEELRTCGTDFG